MTFLLLDIWLRLWMTVYMSDTFKTFYHFKNYCLLDQAFYGYRLSSRDTLISTLVNHNCLYFFKDNSWYLTLTIFYWYRKLSKSKCDISNIQTLSILQCLFEWNYIYFMAINIERFCEFLSFPNHSKLNWIVAQYLLNIDIFNNKSSFN